MVQTNANLLLITFVLRQTSGYVHAHSVTIQGKLFYQLIFLFTHLHLLTVQSTRTMDTRI